MAVAAKIDIKKEIEKFSDAIVNTIRESLLVLDSQLRVVYANNSFYEHFKVTQKETEMKRIYELGNRQWDIPELRELLEKIIPQKKFFSGFEVDHDFPKIGRRIMLVNARQIKDSGSEPLILLAIEDITQEKKLLEYAIQSGKLTAVGKVSAGIAHGLNSPLTGIHNFLQVYYDHERKGSEKSNELKLMLDACDYMAEIIKNFTHFASDKKEQFNKISIISVIESTLLFTERQLVASNIKIKRDFQKDLYNVNGNKGQLQHAFLNILLNAKEAMKDNDKGEITIKAKNNKKNNTAILELIDNGVGIRKEDLSEIFTPFFTTKAASGGAGLGLSMAKQIINHHKGNIIIESEKEKGTRVIITLPGAK